jgi:glycosyltransferase involved in cell wall biosynthesis
MKTIVHIISGLNGGGAEGVLYRLCLNNSVNEHIIISMQDEGKYGQRLRENGIDVHCLNMNSGSLSLSGLYKLFRILLSNKHAVIQTWMGHANLVGGILAKFTGCKKIFWNIRQSNLLPSKSKKKTILIVKIAGFFSKFVPTKIICCAHSALKIHSEIGYDISKMIVIENGYDLENFKICQHKRQSFRSSLSLADSDNLIGMVGRYHPQKNHTLLLKSLALTKKLGYKFKLVLVGRGLNKNNEFLCKEIVNNDLENDVILIDELTDITEVMNGIDLHVLSSSFGEGFPNVIAEAMACGTPCITTDVGDAKIIVGDIGWTVIKDNEERLAESIIIALKEKNNNAIKWNNIRISSRNRIVQKFELSNMINRYNNVWFN